MQILRVHDDHQGERLDVFLTQALSEFPSRVTIKKLIDNGHVKVNESPVKPNYKVQAGDDVSVQVPENFLKKSYAEPEDIPLEIFYEDDSIIIVNKPIGMMVHPGAGCYTGTLVNALKHYTKDLSDFNDGDVRPGIVHRLDQDTSGLMVVAKDNISHTKLAKQFQRKLVKKQYVALVEGAVDFDEGVIREPIGRNRAHRELKAVSYDSDAREAVTYYKTLKRANGVSLMHLFPKTGRTHQLRVHLKHLKHSILGDPKYGKRGSFSRLALHAQSLGFLHPETKQFIEFCTPVPKEFRDKVAD